MIWSDAISNQPVWCPESVEEMDAEVWGVGEKFEDSGRDIEGRRSSTDNCQLQRSHNDSKPLVGKITDKLLNRRLILKMANYFQIRWPFVSASIFLDTFTLKKNCNGGVHFDFSSCAGREF